MTKKERLEALINYYADGQVKDFAKKIGVAISTVSTWKKRNKFNHEKIFANCENLSAEWLITGEGEMIIPERGNILQLRDKIADQKTIIDYQQKLIESLEGQMKLLKGGIAPQTYVETA